MKRATKPGPAAPDKRRPNKRAGRTDRAQAGMAAGRPPARTPPRATAEIEVKRSDKKPSASEGGGQPSPNGRVGSGAARPGSVGSALFPMAPEPAYTLAGPEARVYIGDCRGIIPEIPEAAAGVVDLVFADPPFNWRRAYDRWDDDMPEAEYLDFTFHWIGLCCNALRPGGALWINIPDDWAAEIVCFLKGRMPERRPPCRMSMVNWCVWHYRFGQNATEKFISSKVHVLYFVKAGGKGSAGGERTWRPEQVLEISDRRSIYADVRTESKRDGMPAGHRLPMDVWYGQYWGRVQGNNKERRGYHDNQLPEVYLERVIRATSNPGDLVMDPFLGSGTTGVVAHALQRRFIGTEFSPENAKSAFERMKAGPVRPMNPDAPTAQSTAIFEKRPVGEKRLKRVREAAESSRGVTPRSSGAGR